MADAILATLDSPPSRAVLQARAEYFSADRAIDRYLSVLLSVQRTG